MEKIAIRKDRGLTEIAINGNLNIHNIDLLEIKFRDVIAESGTAKAIVINCENLESIDSSGLGILISLSKQAEKNEIPFYLSSLNRRVSTLFDISNLDRYFRIIGAEEITEIAHR